MLLLPAGLPGQQRSEACTSDDSCRALEGAELHGRVLSSENGRALSGATIEFRVTSPPNGESTATAQVETDRSGSYRFCGIPTPARIEARAERSGATSRSVSFQLDAPRRVELSFEIQGLPANLDSLETAAAVAAHDVEPGRIVGRIEDAATGRPVREATLTLRPAGVQALTDRQGRFTISEVPSGKGTLAIHHVAYGDQTVDVDVPSGHTVDLDIELPPKAIEVEPLEVGVERTVRVPYLERNDFYWRMERGWGHFFAPEFFERHHVISAGQVLHRIPGIRIQGGSLQSGRIKLRNIVACEGWEGGPLLYIDGREVERVSAVQDIHEWVSPASIGAMEVYRRPSETAPEFVSVESACGVIVIWTRRWLGSEVTR